MQFIFTGFSQNMGFRVFAFEGVEKGKLRTEYTVRADLVLVQKYRIPIQELPLLCRRILEQRDVGDQQRVFTYTEADMCLQASLCAEQAAAQKRKRPRRQPSETADPFPN